MADADFITILSSEMIADIVEEHFNKRVYKQKVKVVDTKAAESGYMFSLMIIPPTPVQKTEPEYNPMLLNSKSAAVNGSHQRPSQPSKKKVKP